MRKVKAWLESSNIRNTRENLGLLLGGGLCLQDMDGAEVFNTFFASGFVVSLLSDLLVICLCLEAKPRGERCYMQ